MDIYQTVLWALLFGLVLLLAACGYLLWKLGNQSGRSDVQSAFDDYVSQTSHLAAEAEYERARLSRH